MQLARCKEQWFHTSVRNLKEGLITPLLPPWELQLTNDVAPGLYIAALFPAVSHFVFISPENLLYNCDKSVKPAQNPYLIFHF